MHDLIPRDVLFGNPDRIQARLSPDGRYLSWIASLEGVLNVFVAPIGQLDQAVAVTSDTGRGIQNHFWSGSSERILFLQDTAGDENWVLRSVSPEGGDVVDLTPATDVAAQLIADSPAHPHHVLVGLNNRVPQLHDVYKVDVRTGERELITENPGLIGFVADHDLSVRFGATMQPDGGIALLQLTSDGWAPFGSPIPQVDTLTTHLLGLDASGNTLYMLDSRCRTTAALTAWNLATGEETTLAEDVRADISDVMRHPITGVVQAAASTYARQEWQVLDDDIAPDLRRLQEAQDGEVDVVSRTADDLLWVVATTRADASIAYDLYNRGTAELTHLFSSRAAIDALPLAPMQDHVISARDGLDLVSYLTLPAWTDGDTPSSPLPLVLAVHGGPWARDEWGYNPLHQWLANRGYAVLSVNFRGSTGFGKHFVAAGDREWGAKMHDDLLDAVEWAVERGVADASKVAVLGGSYGGYAALAALTFTPTTFACAVDIVGPSNLLTLLETIPPYWAPMKTMFHTRVGNDETEEGRAFLAARSPLSHVDKIVRPLLIGQGANDPRVKQAESDQIVSAMQERGIPVTYALFPDEGHGFVRPQNRLAFWGLTEQFLAEHLGGRAEPMGTSRDGSSMEVVTGA